MEIQEVKKALTILVIVYAISSISSADPVGMWSEKKAWQWYNNQPWLVGCNYIPATAVNQLEMWQEQTFDPETIDKELKWASEIGFNIVRVFLHDMLWQQDAEGFVKRIDQFLAIANKHNIKVMPILLDSCWNPHPKLGKQPDPKPHVHNPAWVQSPHIEKLKDIKNHDSFQDYVQGVITRYKKDDRIIIWDLYNEPGNTNQTAYGHLEPKNKVELSLHLLRKAFQWAREVKPDQPLTASVWTGDWTKGADIPAINKFALENSDLVQFHVYHGPEITRQWIKILQAYKRPILCGEYMSRGTGCTFESILPIFKEHRIAAINWGLVAGKTQTNYPWETWTKKYTAEPQLWFHDIFRPDGKPYRLEEVEFIKKIVK